MYWNLSKTTVHLYLLLQIFQILWFSNFQICIVHVITVLRHDHTSGSYTCLLLKIHILHKVLKLCRALTSSSHSIFKKSLRLNQESILVRVLKLQTHPNEVRTNNIHFSEGNFSFSMGFQTLGMVNHCKPISWKLLHHFNLKMNSRNFLVGRIMIQNTSV